MRTCIFDLDGTLTETMDSITYSVNETLKEMKLDTISKEKCRSLVGYGARVLMTRALKVVGDENADRIDEAMRVYGRVFDKNCTYNVKPYQGITEMLKELKKHQLKLAVLSNKPHIQTVKVVKEIFGENVFDIVQGQENTFVRKPDPAGVFSILDQLNAKPEECIYIGDSEVDIATGHNANVLTIGVAWGFRSVGQLEEAGAENIVHEPKEILNYL